MPEYHDPIESGFYVQWYQPRQIQLGYRILSDLAPAPAGLPWQQPYSRLFSDLERGVHLVDYGCGALAFPLGLTLFVAECLRNSKPVGQVQVEGFDYEAMLAIGLDVWRELRKSCQRRGELRYLADAIDRITLNLHGLTPDTTNHHSLHIRHGRAGWLSAIHIVYESNLTQMKDNLSQFITFFAPEFTVFTAPKAKMGSNGLESIDPFISEGKHHKGFWPTWQWDDDAQHITGLRLRIAEYFGLADYSSLTSRPVSWHIGGGDAQPFAVWYDNGVNVLKHHGK